jgi:hypothetical protein
MDSDNETDMDCDNETDDDESLPEILNTIYDYIKLIYDYIKLSYYIKPSYDNINPLYN